MRRSLLLVAVLSAAAAGCATHAQMRAPWTMADSGLLGGSKSVTAVERALTDKDIAMLLDADVRAKLPTRVAVAGFQSGCYRRLDGLKTIAGEELEGWEALAQDQPFIAGVHPVSPFVTGASDVTLHDLRSAAARMNCELLLVYLESDDSLSNYNNAAALYWTLVGLFVVPGTVYEHRTVDQAVLVDCRTGVILGTATGDSHLKQACPAAYGSIQEDKLAQRAPREALSDLQAASRKLLKQVVDAAAPPPG